MSLFYGYYPPPFISWWIFNELWFSVKIALLLTLLSDYEFSLLLRLVTRMVLDFPAALKGKVTFGGVLSSRRCAAEWPSCWDSRHLLPVPPSAAALCHLQRLSSVTWPAGGVGQPAQHSRVRPQSVTARVVLSSSLPATALGRRGCSPARGEGALLAPCARDAYLGPILDRH